MNINEEVKSIRSKIIAHRRHIHKNPELSFQEFKTSKYIQNQLTSLGIEYKVMAKTGVIGLIGKGDKCVALRADIDALPVKEETGLPYCSVNDGVMHACGHDMHTAMLLGAAEILKKNEDQLNGQVKLIFQPAEEMLPGGAKVLIEEGVLENPTVDAVFGQHIDPTSNFGTVSIAGGPVMASTDELYININADGCHAAQPHFSGDPIVAASNLIMYLQSIISRMRDPLLPGVLSISSFNSGNTTNIIPSKAKLMGTLRSYNQDWRDFAKTKIEKACKYFAELYDVEIECEIRSGFPTVINDDKLAEQLFIDSEKILAKDKILKMIPKMWAEDFSYYTQNKASVFWFLGIKAEEVESMPALHNPKLSPNEDAMEIGTSMLVNSAISFLNCNK